ncbi:MAG TPA: hypothetical protein VGF80_14680 [Galbitalea sp.]|jgi:hypothetical protein
MTEPETAIESSALPFTFRYWLHGRGWADAIIESHDRQVPLTASWLSDALRLLLEAVDDFVAGSRTSEASWEEEPGQYRWVFDRPDETPRLRVLAERGTRQLDKTLESLSGSSLEIVREGRAPEAVLFEGRASDNFIAAAIAAGARETLLREGEVRYFEKWGAGTFPLDVLNSIERKIGLSITEAPTSVAPEPDPRRPELIAQWRRFVDGQSDTDEMERWLRRQPSFDYPQTTLIKSGLKIFAEQVKTADRLRAVPEDAAAAFEQWLAEAAAYDADPMAWYRSNDRLVEQFKAVRKPYRLELARRWQKRKGNQVVQAVLDQLGITWDELIADAPEDPSRS